MTVSIQADTEGAQEVTEHRFRFCCFGNFSGSTQQRAELRTLKLGLNQWDTLFRSLTPTLTLPVSLPGVSDLEIEIVFTALGDFHGKGLTARVPLLGQLTELAERAGAASEEEPLPLSEFRKNRPELEFLNRLAATAGGQTIDLLSMVDLGGEEEDTLHLPGVKALFQQDSYTGEKRTALVNEIQSVKNMILDQLQNNEALQKLHGLWRGLKLMLPYLRESRLDVDLVDCLKDELCDATYLLFLKPDRGSPQTLDLAFYAYAFDHGEADRHIVYHLGRMAEHLRVPFILEADLGLFRCRNWTHLSHVSDLDARLMDAAHIKWRKLREEPGSQWLFMAVNPIQAEGAAEAGIGAAFVPALLCAQFIRDSGWPGELMGLLARLDLQMKPLANLSESARQDLAYHGFCPVIGRDEGVVGLAGMTCFGHIKVPARDQQRAAAVVEYTLPYRFFSGCCSRFLERLPSSLDRAAALRAFVGVRSPEQIEYEHQQEGHWFRIKPPFTILGVQADLVIHLPH